MNTKRYFELKQELNKFLEENPHLKELQKEIEEKLDKAGSDHNRMVVIQEMMMESLRDLGDNFKKL